MFNLKILLFLVNLNVLATAIAQVEYQINTTICADSMNFPFTGHGEAPIILLKDYQTHQPIQFKHLDNNTLVFVTDAARIRIEFLNFYHQKIDTVLMLSQEKLNYHICLDQFKDYDLKTSVAKSIDKKKKWVLTLSANGFYAMGLHYRRHEQLKLTYKHKQVYATHYIDQEKKKTVLLSARQQKALIRFEKQLRCLTINPKTCQIARTYTVRSRYETYHTTIHSCFWSGYRVLKRQLGLLN